MTIKKIVRKQQTKHKCTTGAKATFCAGHKLPQHSELHGHSYEVWAFTDSGCAEAWQQTLKNAVAELDHRTLPADLPTMEDIAVWVGNRTGAVKVKVIRPVEGLCAEMEIE